MSRRLQRPPTGKSKVEQGALRDTDLNRIVENSVRRNTPLPAGSAQPIWGDFTAMDFHAAQNLIVQVRTDFALLPAKVRGLFSNNPERLLEFVQDPKNLETARKLGLALPEAQKAPRPVTQDDLTAAVERIKADRERGPRVQQSDLEDPA